MLVTPLGKIPVPVPGTPEYFVSASRSVHGLFFSQLPGQSAIYIGTVGMNKTTKVGVIYVIPPAGTNFHGTFAIGADWTTDSIDARHYQIDADVAGEGPLVSLLEI